MPDTETTDLGLSDLNPSCSCCGDGTNHAKMVAPGLPVDTSFAVADTVNSVYAVDGMTCSHCVASVTDEIKDLEGVKGISVELHAGGESQVTVASVAPIPEATIRAAIEAAGYTLSAHP